MSLRKEQRAESRADYAYRVIRRRIVRLEMYPGQRINEGGLAKELGVSRTPIHEAVLRLHSEHLVHVVPRQESSVSLIDLSLVSEGIFLRCVVEAGLIKSMAGCLPKQTVAAMRYNLELQRAALGKTDRVYEFLHLDREFHRHLFVASDKMEILSLVDRMAAHLTRMQHLVQLEGFLQVQPANLEDHHTLFRVLSFGVPPDFDVEAHVKAHILRFKVDLPAVQRAHSEYFV